MRIISELPWPEGVPVKTLRTPRLGILVSCALILPLSLGCAFLLCVAAGSVSALGWLLLGPIVLLVGGSLLLLNQCLLEALLASSRPGSWVMRLGPDGICLNLRHFLNATREPSEDTLLFLPDAEIESARRVRILGEQPMNSDESPSVELYLELDLRCGTEEVQRAVQRELGRPGSVRRFLGMSMTSQSVASPVVVAGPARLRVLWCGRRMLSALGARGVELGGDRGVSESLDPSDSAGLEARLLELRQRGQTLAAIRLARRALSLSLSEAKELVEGLDTLDVRERRGA